MRFTLRAEAHSTRQSVQKNSAQSSEPSALSIFITAHLQQLSRHKKTRHEGGFQCLQSAVWRLSAYFVT